MIHKKKKSILTWSDLPPDHERRRAGAIAKNFGLLLQKHGSFGSTPDKWRPDAIQLDPNLWINMPAR